MNDKAKKSAETIANDIMMGVQANKYGTCVYNTERCDFNHGHLVRAAQKGYENAEEEIRKKLLKFFADNITHGCDKGLIINIPNYTELINRCSEALEIDLIPLIKH